MRRLFVAAAFLFGACAGLGAAQAQEVAAASTSPALPPLTCATEAVQGGAVVCRTAPGAVLSLNGAEVAVADAAGLAVLGLPMDQKSPAKVRLEGPPSVPMPFDPALREQLVDVAERDDPVSRFEMDCGKISPQTPEQKRHAEVSWVKKAKALEVFSEPVADLGFSKPADGPYSSPFGAVRTYVPKTPDCKGRTSVHHGLDIAVGTGTPVVAPMGGTVILADPDLFYEGGCVFVDHGRGLISILMHMSRIDVKPGDVLQAGGQLGLSGSTGRVTGPHVHWAIKYRNVNSDDRGTDLWLDPSLLLKLDTVQPPVGE